MLFKLLSTFLFFLCVATLRNDDSGAEESASPPVFVATREWQKIEPGQSVPPGLHYKVDFGGTGGERGTWAKLLEDDAPPSASVALVATASEVEEEEVSPATTATTAAVLTQKPPAADAPVLDDLGLSPADAERGRVLLGLPASGEGGVDGLDELAAAVSARMPPAQLEALLERVWASRQAALRERMETFKTEAQQMRTLLDTLIVGGGGGEESIITLLEDLEFFVSSVHNAEDFAAMGGIPVSARLLNATSPRVAAAAAWTLGTATKGAPLLAQAAVDEGALIALVSMLRSHVAVASAAVAQGGGGLHTASPSLRVAAKGVYAVGALTRFFAPGQRQLIHLRGGSLLAAALDVATSIVAVGGEGGESASSAVAGARAVAEKVVRLVGDLAGEGAEREPIKEEGADGASAQQLRIRLKAAAEVGVGTPEGGLQGTVSAGGGVTVGGEGESAWLLALRADDVERTALCTSLRAWARVVAVEAMDEGDAVALRLALNACL